MYEYYFEGRKPSKAQVKKLAIQALKAGHSQIEISWGENMLEIQRAHTGQVHGYGWIKNIGGQDLADELQSEGY